MKTKKVFMVMTAMMLSASPIYADSITDGIGSAGDAVYSYTPVIQSLGYALAAIIGLVGAFVVYHAIQNNERDIQKRILRWGGGTIARARWLAVSDGEPLTQLSRISEILSGALMTVSLLDQEDLLSSNKQ